MILEIPKEVTKHCPCRRSLVGIDRAGSHIFFLHNCCCCSSHVTMHVIADQIIRISFTSSPCFKCFHVTLVRFLGTIGITFFLRSNNVIHDKRSQSVTQKQISKKIIFTWKSNRKIQGKRMMMWQIHLEAIKILIRNCISIF